MTVINGFKTFLLRGNAVDLSVGVVVGGAFTAIVKGVTDGVLNPFVAVIFRQQDLSRVGEFHINHTLFQPGLVIDALLKFILVATAIYFFVVLPFNLIHARFAAPVNEEPSETVEDILTDIRDTLKADDPQEANTAENAIPDDQDPSPRKETD